MNLSPEGFDTGGRGRYLVLARLYVSEEVGKRLSRIRSCMRRDRMLKKRDTSGRSNLSHEPTYCLPHPSIQPPRISLKSVALLTGPRRFERAVSLLLSQLLVAALVRSHMAAIIYTYLSNTTPKS